MVKSKQKILSIVLCIMLVVSTFCVGSITATAASGDTIYINADNGWSNVYVYVWNSNSDAGTAWPGTQATKVSGSIYKYTFTKDYANIIFNNGSGAQTKDLTYTGNGGNGKVYNLSSGTWANYESGSSVSSSSTVAEVGAGNTDSVYCKNSAGWSNVYVYMWNSTSDTLSAWPGVPMTNEGNGVWSYTPSKKYANVIFSNSGSPQTADITAQYGSIFDNVTSTWTKYASDDTTSSTVTSSTPSSKPSSSSTPSSTPTGNDNTIYYKNNSGWSSVTVYMWNSTTDTLSAWPGVAMTNEGNGVWSYTPSKKYANLIFSNNGGSQTADIVAQYGSIYDNGTWSSYSGGGSSSSGGSGQSTQPTTPTGDYVIYCKNTAGWSNVTCYMWSSSTDSNTGWPGAAMTNLGDGVWAYTASKPFSSVIFSNSGNSQTSDLTATGHYGYYYDNGSGAWEIYDTSPIRVSSFTADPETAIYKGMEVTLSTAAKSGQGTVSYKISVTDGTKTTILSNFGANNTVTWVPTTAGKYTVNFDYKDTAKNTNSRKIDIEVLDDAGVKKPILKLVTPGMSSVIKQNATTTVNVTAGGGVTGTNLLFYKYVVTDPSGKTNTPYYTLNSSYSFVPKSLGTYKVSVYVQSSDNTTVTKTYTYEATATGTQPGTSAPVIDVVLGDANGDGEVTISDATAIQMYIAHYKNITIDLENADVNGDGTVNIHDVTKIQLMLTSLA